MKLDKQRRLTIPEFIRKEGQIKKLEKYFLVYIRDNLYKIEKSFDNEKVLGQLKTDEKGRIVIPKYVSDNFEEKNILMYVENGRVWLKITP